MELDVDLNQKDKLEQDETQDSEDEAEDVAEELKSESTYVYLQPQTAGDDTETENEPEPRTDLKKNKIPNHSANTYLLLHQQQKEKQSSSFWNSSLLNQVS